MSFEASTVINQAEESAKKGHAQVLADAKTAEVNAVAEGKATVERAIAEAKKQVQDQQVLLDAEAAKAAEALAKETEQNKAALRAGAEGRLDQAASLIVERIVNG